MLSLKKFAREGLSFEADTNVLSIRIPHTYPSLYLSNILINKLFISQSTPTW